MDSDLIQRMQHLEERQDRLETRMNDIAKSLESSIKKIEENTDTTNAIKKDTSQIVALFKASQLGASLIKWCASVGGGLILAYAALKGITGH